MEGALECVVARDEDFVFDFIADIRNETQWNPRIVGVEKVSEGAIGLGSRFRGAYKGLGTLETELVVFDRPRSLSFVSRGARMDIDGTFTLTAGGGGGTTVSLVARLEPRGALRLAAPLMTPVLRRQNLTAGMRLKVALEQAPEPN